MMQEREFKSHGLRAVAINANTISAARLRGEDLWIVAREDVSMLCLSPEQLISKGFADLLEYKPFWKRFCILGVDKIHLLYQWGMSFRLVFQQIEYIRSRCPPWIITMGLSVTVAKGRVMDHVCKFLGYRPGKFHLIRHDRTPDTMSNSLFRSSRMDWGDGSFCNWIGSLTNIRKHSFSV